ncbi:MAG: DNA-directed RNA polymerase subunit beta' [Candidatus Harrisonbacteria bacterium CG10_big_fil_rev_8_21_14_0_10_42_17]|uniref:DNA-directed RNA polymerase subunit beta' n=1 Tax=Candidatus Harrisonbacteria bacterium CG10_big_fil_rev_8_21_14_0_10_42_17 TaxID=1974584 RepID=A0A2M6WIQ6_9BACT|nr:MAG: DNA-directed RNA polymerase subunit beta' [Candidatus Harrisonbacteria bacterium CG10_big_fil_rev_8_21_14_0_10_42_17]
MFDFNAIRLKLASPEDVLRWSHGEVTKPETINYRTQRPEKDGLFSERIFGPTKDWECYCGKYRRIRYKGVVCDKCGVEVTRAIVRRERMGHIELATPVIHIWYLRSIPSKISMLLDVPLPKLERVVYYASYIVTSIQEERKKEILQELEKEFKARKKSAKEEGVKVEDLKTAMTGVKKQLEQLRVGQVLTESEWHTLARRFGDSFEAGIGADAIRTILKTLDLKALLAKIKKDLSVPMDPLKEAKILRRLKLVNGMLKNGISPEWMVISVLPILPPDLRPMVALDGGRYATSDLNDLYRRVINRNNRLKKLMELKAPEVIVVNEKRMLQEAVDALIDNSARFGSQQLSSQRRPLRSLADMLKGKQGRFRQNLLGKRVDYSGRSVIVIGPELRIDECGIPKRMALELFKPFVINKIIERELAYNIRNANRLIEQATPEIWAILEEVIEGRKLLLNRAPTLHRLGVQAFKPKLTEDLAIRVPALVTTAFNADFDGDQMAVHLPLSEEAQREASTLMLSSLNLLKPATGDAIVTPTQDIVLGCYYLTKIRNDAPGFGMRFSSGAEARIAYANGVIKVNSRILIGPPSNELETSVGRLQFNDSTPQGFRFVNATMTKKELSTLMSEIIEEYGNEEAVNYLNTVQRLGFRNATSSGVSWGMGDLITPPEKKQILKNAEEKVKLIRSQYEQGLLTNAERKARVISVWYEANTKLNKEVVPHALAEDSPVHTIISSGARGSWSQPGQMMGMKGLVQNARGETVELPITSSFKEGFKVLEYFISTHGSRKGLTDTALKTAQAGYLTRRLVDVAQDLIIQEEDCGVKEGINIVRAEGDVYGHSFAHRIFSRTALSDIKIKNKVVVKKDVIIDRGAAQAIEDSSLESIPVRSTILCKTLYGLCVKCYGYDLGRNRPVEIGAAVGIVAAQSIGEPGTQLTMRTFHIGGVAGADITHGLPRVEELFEVRPPKGKAALSEVDGIVDAIEEQGLSMIMKIRPLTKDKTDKLIEVTIPRSSEIYFQPGDEVKKGDRLSEGNLDLRELFALRSVMDVQRYILNEVQKIYSSEGASINDKHVEVIIRQMFSRVRVKDPGDTNLVTGDILQRSFFLESNRRVKATGGLPAKAEQRLLGITKVALSTESFLSAASFIETAKVLINASVEARVDRLHGLKENVIIGRLIPAGTGKRDYSNKGSQVQSEEAVEVNEEKSLT